MRLSPLFKKPPAGRSCDEDVNLVSNDFEYEPLPDAQTHIRLLKIIDAQAGQLAKCTLTTWPLESIPSYCAISYTWGDPSDTTVIEVNTKRKIVRPNCEYVLQQGFASDWNGYYWVDAICIDQQNIDEKNLQVAMMGDLYQKATRVFACVGPAADDSDYLFDFLKKHKRFFRDVYKDLMAWQSDDKRSSTDATELELYDDYYRARDFHMWHSGASWRALILRRTRLIVAYVCFVERSYFSRVWV